MNTKKPEALLRRMRKDLDQILHEAPSLTEIEDAVLATGENLERLQEALSAARENA